MKILIVDDSKTMRMIVQKTLKNAGFGHHNFLEAANGMEALDVFKSNQPDLILCDWNMPVLNGIKFLEKLREINTDVPFGFITSEGTDEMIGQAKLAGAQFYITKPFSPEKFKAEMDKVLK
jgi:two-component system chemotaxis response regulator CheY